MDIASVTMWAIIGLTIVIISAIVVVSRKAKPATEQKTIKCRNCNEGTMVTSYTKKFNVMGLIGAIIASWVSVGLLFIPATLNGIAGNTIPSLIWFAFWGVVFFANLAAMEKRTPTWTCKNCDYTYVKGKLQQ